MSGAIFKRKIWKSDLKTVKQKIYDQEINAVFVKPDEATKKFTGLVLSDPADFYLLNGAGGTTSVFCSDLVSWLSEFRVFILRNEILGMHYYSGDAQLIPDMETIKAAVHIFSESGTGVSTYAVDFGVLQGGETALIELNDAYSLGAYGLDYGLYTDLLMARWEEMMLMHKKN